MIENLGNAEETVMAIRGIVKGLIRGPSRTDGVRAKHVRDRQRMGCWKDIARVQFVQLFDVLQHLGKLRREQSRFCIIDFEFATILPEAETKPK